MNYGTIKYYDIANGEGVRTSLFVSGCRHHCPDCFNAVAWDFSYGLPFTKKEEDEIISSLSPYYIKGLSLLGGEPMEKENQEGVLSLLERVENETEGKDVWIYSGFTFEELVGTVPSRAFSPISRKILEKCDVLVDGKFMKEEKDISLQFRGSRNQRIIDLRATFDRGEIVLWKDKIKEETR
ncbi:MAG: anaerobic ribonucleoside-triphosphate reductase activating protein [Candidatus Ornithospirochaeta sp.]